MNILAGIRNDRREAIGIARHGLFARISSLATVRLFRAARSKHAILCAESAGSWRPAKIDDFRATRRRRLLVIERARRAWRLRRHVSGGRCSRPPGRRAPALTRASSRPHLAGTEFLRTCRKYMIFEMPEISDFWGRNKHCRAVGPKRATSRGSRNRRGLSTLTQFCQSLAGSQH